jgi:hypothetical protein
MNVVYSSTDIDALTDNAFMGLPPMAKIEDSKNMLLDSRPEAFFTEPEDYVKELVFQLMQPENFALTCKLLLNIELMPFQLFILNELWNRKFPMLIATRGGGKTWILSLYSLLRAIFTQGSKVVVVGAAFRQSKLLFEYMEGFWRNAPILRHLVGRGKHEGPKRDIDRCNFYIGDSEITAIPLGDGTKIRGLRANYVVADEFASIPQEIYEVVIRGFTAVSANPSERVRSKQRINVLKQLGMYIEASEEEEALGYGNQTILSGTAYYHFNHFYDYWKRYKNIIESQGQQRKLEEIFHGEVPKAFDWTQFSVFRVPHTKLPVGFMDETQIAQSQATVHLATHRMEYEAIFAEDSDGFFKRSLIESCVTSKPIMLPSGAVQFAAALAGEPGVQYVYGIDPASEQDNFAIVILEVRPDHRRIVYSWTVNRQILRERTKNRGKSSDKSFYAYCARKIRDLMQVFPTDHIGIDTQGGGVTVMETLHDKNELDLGELPLWPYVKQGDDDVFWWEDKEKPTDREVGRHILHMIQFAKADWTVKANHGLRKDFETKAALFPFFDAPTLGVAASQDKILGREYDTLEDCVMEIEELKDELTTIIHDQTTGGRDRWDTPEVKLPGNKKGRLRKDRYSALVIANMIARTMIHGPSLPAHQFVGGFVGQSNYKSKGQQMYVGPDHIVGKIDPSAYCGFSRSGK